MDLSHQLAGLVMIAALTVTASAAASTGSTPYLIDGTHLSRRPVRAIDLSGTSRIEVTDLRWLRWGRTEATALTTFRTNTCTPSCAASNYEVQPARLRLSRPVPCRAKKVFNHFVVVGRNQRVLRSGDFRSLGYLRSC